jgi:4-amino-4-deoxy-L-arabinose transferase-like glycosyltransferase
VLALIRRHLRFFVLGSAAAIILRLFFIVRFPGVVNDSFIYGDIAKNWLLHGTYGFSDSGGVSATYIRLPGYPAFLALVFAIFGLEHYRAVLLVQMFIDLGTCFVCADVARRLFSPKAAMVAFTMCALCPFLANYSAAALTETLEIFFTALAIDSAICALQENRLMVWAACGASCAAAILLRPDGALLVIVIVVFLLGRVLMPKAGRATAGSPAGATASRRCLVAIVIVALIAIAPLAPWALRNWRVFHRFQALAPRYANEEDEFVPMGFNRWTKTWITDYVSVEEIYWPVPGSTIDTNNLPARAFDSEPQRQQTLQLVDDYNRVLHISPPLDRRFDSLAAERIRTDPARYYVWLPLLRIADMWLRPRTEMLPSDSRWWEFNDEPKWAALAICFGLINLFYLMTSLVGWMRVRFVAGTGLLLLFVLLRSIFLGTLENPEPRYTLEMYPVAVVFAAAAMVRRKELIQSCELMTAAIPEANRSS